LFVAATLIVSCVQIALAGPREQAERIHDRLAGVPPTDAATGGRAASAAARTRPAAR